MLWSLFLQIAAGILGLYLADRFVGGVEFSGPLFYFPQSQNEISTFLTSLIAAGTALGILNAIAKPILNKITFPLRIITLNLFSLVIAMAMVWVVDIFSPELVISGIVPLFWTTIIVWALGFALTNWLPMGRKNLK